MDSQPKPSMALLGFGVPRTRMVAFGLVSEFSECSKNLSVADTRPQLCSRSTASTASAWPCACHSLSLCFGSESHSFIFFSLLYLHFLQQLSVTYVSLYELLPASRSCPASFPACFEHGVAAPAISALAVATSVCRESQRMRVIMLSDPGPDRERTSTAAPSW